MIYRDKSRIVHILQIKFVNKINLQARQIACRTTNPDSFYCKRSKSTEVLAGYEEIKNETRRLFRQVECKSWLFLHSNKQAETGLDGVKIIDRVHIPKFFDSVDKDGYKMWNFLDTLRDKFEMDKQ